MKGIYTFASAQFWMMGAPGQLQRSLPVNLCCADWSSANAAEFGQLCHGMRNLTTSCKGASQSPPAVLNDVVSPCMLVQCGACVHKCKRSVSVAALCMGWSALFPCIARSGLSGLRRRKTCWPRLLRSRISTTVTQGAVRWVRIATKGARSSGAIIDT